MMKISKMWRSGAAMLLAGCMVAGTFSNVSFAAEKAPLVYVSIGDSMTNGFCLDGYDGNSGGINYGIGTYANKFAAWLAGYDKEVKDDQVIFEGDKATVDHRPLAISGMRSQDIEWILKLDYENDSLINDVYANEYNVKDWIADDIESKWYDTWKFPGDYRTYADFCDSDYRYADAAARILSVYNTGDNGNYYKTSEKYADATAINNAITGVKNNPYFPQGRNQADMIGGAKYLQIATEYYQKSVEDADIISLAVGNTNFGTYMLQEILDVAMDAGDNSFAERYDYNKLLSQVADNEFMMGQIDAMLASESYQKALYACKQLGGSDVQAERIGYIVKYCVVSYMAGYMGMLDAVLEMNPDADIIQIALMNAYENQTGTVEAGSLGELVETIYTPMNQFLSDLPETEHYAKYAEAEFFFAEAPYVSCMVDVFGDDFYMDKNGNYVEYPGPLNGTEGYTANYNSTVRARFVEEIVCGDMIFAAMGLAKENTQENIQAFLKGVFEYDMMTAVQKAAFAAQDADTAKEYALYLGFENAIIRSGTENITMASLANLANISSAFEEFYPIMMEAIGIASADYYGPAAELVASQSGGALTKDQLVAIMQMSPEAQAMVPYQVVAQKINAMAGDMGEVMSGADIKSLCDAENYETAVYELIVKLAAEKFGYDMTPSQIETLVKEEDGAYIVASQMTGGEYDASTIKTLYEMGLLESLKPEAAAGIDMLFTVKELVIKLLDSESTIKEGVSSVQFAIKSTGDLAYLLAIPTTMGDELFANDNMRGALCMNARCILGTGAGGHPSLGGHQALYNAVMKAYANVEEPTDTFTDVEKGKFYYDAVYWAVDKGITNGITATTFEPNTSCTRAQAVTFLYRLAGKPSVAGVKNPFTDLDPKAFYYDAVLWAVSEGITTGTTATTFEPNATCTRGQIVTFIWRANDKEAAKNTTHPFTDVKEGAYYYNAMLWAVENGITKGITATTFEPDATCTRGQIVTFLYRGFAE